MGRISGSVFNLDDWQLTQSHVREDTTQLTYPMKVHNQDFIPWLKYRSRYVASFFFTVVIPLSPFKTVTGELQNCDQITKK